MPRDDAVHKSLGSFLTESNDNDKSPNVAAADMRSKFFKGNLASARQLESALSGGDGQSADSEAIVEEPQPMSLLARRT